MEDVVTHEKGVEAVLIKSWLEQYYSSDMEEIIDKLSPDARDMITSPAANQWYPLELMKEVYTVIYEVTKEKDPKAIVDYGRFSAERSASGLLRFLMKFIDMNKLIERMKAFWKHYHKGGKITASELVEEAGRKKRIVAYHGYDAGQAACLAPLGYLKAIAERAGAKNVKVLEKTCIHKGDKVCSWEVSWES
ncbi:hypothetical protein JXM67_02910 [candidate division WOR-3 bacterium]|nr:hypothetical protein [candidate division WOR-3 bacterium]